MTDSSFFSNIPASIPYEGPESDNVLAFKYYDANKIVAGKPMKDWLRFSVCTAVGRTLTRQVCYWHTFRGNGADMFGEPTISRPWDDGTNSVDNAKRRLRVAFEFFKRHACKCGVITFAGLV
jgi:xylose isomerase